MKRFITFLILFALILSLSGCGGILHGTDDLIQKARAEFPLADSEYIPIQYAGTCGKDNLALVWFISGNKYQTHSYLAMECEVVGKNTYRFIRTYKPMDRGQDIAILEWQSGYVFLINNPQCKSVRITDSSGTYDEIIQKDTYPYIFFCTSLPDQYEFLDENNAPM